MTVLVKTSSNLTDRPTDWQLEVNSARKVQLKGASQRGQEPLNTKAEEAISLEAVTK
jgi:hypothetical protein